METEWKTGIDFAKEFDKHILQDNLDFDKILEEANNMQREGIQRSGRQVYDTWQYYGRRWICHVRYPIDVVTCGIHEGIAVQTRSLF